MDAHIESKSQILDDFVTPKLAKLGLQWRNDNSWVEPGDIAIRRIVRFVPLKGISAVMEWGLSLSFVPHFSGRRLVYHKTFRAARFDLFEWPRSYRESFSGSIHFARVDCRNEVFRNSMESYFHSIIPEIDGWFNRVRSLETIEMELEQQIENPDLSYKVHHPSPMFVLAFARAATGQTETAKKLLSNTHHDSWDEMQVNALQLALAKAPLV